jgi:hypothetical protein
MRFSMLYACLYMRLLPYREPRARSCSCNPLHRTKSTSPNRSHAQGQTCPPASGVPYASELPCWYMVLFDRRPERVPRGFLRTAEWSGCAGQMRPTGARHR